MIAKKQNTNKVKHIGVFMRLSEDLHHAFKLRCLIENRLMQDVVSELITQYLRENTKKDHKKTED